jgi:predicted RNase H-like HicB family nuclease
MRATYDAVFEQHEGWWVGHADNLPGALGQGRTLEEARESLKEAIVLLECQRKDHREGLA